LHHVQNLISKGSREYAHVASNKCLAHIARVFASSMKQLDKFDSKWDWSCHWCSSKGMRITWHHRYFSLQLNVVKFVDKTLNNLDKFLFVASPLITLQTIK